MPDAKRLALLGHGRVSHVPALFDGTHRYCREHNRYLRERAQGDWHPRAATGSGETGKAPSPKTVVNVARHIGTFIDWCEARGADWRTLDYQGVLAFQNDMVAGRWSRSRRKLDPRTANLRADEVTSFLAWAAHRQLRPAFTVERRCSKRRFKSSTSAEGGRRESWSRLGRAKESATKKVNAVAALPTPEEVKVWLAAVRARRGYAKSLACRFILETGVRREELVCLEVDQVPSAEVLAELRNKGRREGPMTLRVTKGGRSRTISVSLALLEELRSWVDGKRLTMSYRDNKRREAKKLPRRPASTRLFLSDARDHEGTPISSATIYKTFREVTPRPSTWHPHMGRHTYACFTLLYAVEAEAAAAGSSLDKMQTSWVHGRGEWHLDLLRRQLGHVDENTTQIYLRWLITAAGLATTASGWQTFLAGDGEGAGHEGNAR